MKYEPLVAQAGVEETACGLLEVFSPSVNGGRIVWAYTDCPGYAVCVARLAAMQETRVIRSVLDNQLRNSARWTKTDQT